MQDAYRYELAWIHDAGFSDPASNAAPVVIEELQRVGSRSGTVVDLGCGSGIASRLLRDAGYEVVGIDLSEPLIEMARERVPDATFRVGFSVQTLTCYGSLPLLRGVVGFLARRPE